MRTRRNWGEPVMLLLELVIWIGFFVVGALLWMRDLYLAGHLVVFGVVAVGWTIWKWKTRIPAGLILIGWCIVLLFVHAVFD